MARRNHWIKLYVEINDDPKIGLLPVNARWRFISALALAGELDDGGFIPPVNDELAYRLHTEVETLQSEMRMLAGRGWPSYGCTRRGRALVSLPFCRTAGAQHTNPTCTKVTLDATRQEGC